jgi:hypothetical protein
MSIRKLLIVPAVLLSLAYGFGMASIASAEVVIVTVVNHDCSYEDDTLSCEAWYPLVGSGVQQVIVTMDTGIGAVEVFDQTYKGCPESVTFELDPIVMDYDTHVKVIPCPPDPGVGQPDVGSFKQKPAPAPIRLDSLVSRN